MVCSCRTGFVLALVVLVVLLSCARSCAPDCVSCGVFCAGNETKPPLFPLALMRSLALLWHGIVPPGIRPPVYSAAERQFCPPSLRIECFFPRMSVWLDTLAQQPHTALYRYFTVHDVESILSKSKVVTGAYRCRTARAGRTIRSVIVVLTALVKVRTLITPLVSLVPLYIFCGHFRYYAEF